MVSGVGEGDPPGLRDRSLLLDVLRIFAASWVVIYHWTRESWFDGAPGTVTTFAEAGYLGVDVFFMLSGAVIVYTAIGRTWRAFAVSRFLRLFPAYFGATVIIGAFLIATGRLSPTPAGWTALTGLHFFVREPSFVGVAWTLLYEVLFYVLIGVLILVCRNKLTEDGIRRGVMVFLLVALFAQFSGNRELNLLTISGFGGMFALGALLGISRTAEQLKRNLPGIVIAAVLTYVRLTGRAAETGFPDYGVVILSVAVLAGVSAIILWSAMRPSRIRGIRLRHGVATISLMTYPMYLIHLDLGLGLINLARSADIPLLIAGAGSAVLMVLLSWVSVRFYEPWARGRLRSWFGWTVPPRVAVGAAP